MLCCDPHPSLTNIPVCGMHCMRCYPLPASSTILLAVRINHHMNLHNFLANRLIVFYDMSIDSRDNSLRDTPSIKNHTGGYYAPKSGNRI